MWRSRAASSLSARSASAFFSMSMPRISSAEILASSMRADLIEGEPEPLQGEDAIELGQLIRGVIAVARRGSMRRGLRSPMLS